MWNGTLYKNGVIGVRVDCSTGGKTNGDITVKHSSETLWFLRTQVLSKPFGYLLQIILASNFCFCFWLHRGIWGWALSWIGEGTRRYGIGSFPSRMHKGNRFAGWGYVCILRKSNVSIFFFKVSRFVVNLRNALTIPKFRYTYIFF